MKIEYNEIFWGDSTIEEIGIKYDELTISIFNDVLQKKINVICSKCIGISEIFIWDEVTIENIFIEEVVSSEHPMWKKIYELYGTTSYDSEKDILKPFYELKVVLINDLEFKVLCQVIDFVGTDDASLCPN